MSPTEAKRIVEAAKAHARSRGHAQDADDFAQEAFIALAGGRKASLEQLLIDYLRKEYGSTGARRGAGRSSKVEVRRAASLDAPIRDDDARTLHDCIAGPGGDPGPVGLDWRDRAHLGAREERILELLEEGWDQVEIAEIFAVTESRISQLVIAARPELERARIMSESYDLYKADPTASLLVVEWINL